MMYAEKLPINFDLSKLSEDRLSPHKKYTKLQRRYAGEEKSNFVRHTQTFTLSNQDEFLGQLPQSLLDLEVPHISLLEIPAHNTNDPVLPPHIDINKTCGINVYLETNGEATVFYNWNKQSRQIEYQEEFCASAGDCWLMDTTTPHEVRMTSNKRRRLLTFSFTKAKYQEVLAAL